MSARFLAVGCAAYVCGALRLRGLRRLEQVERTRLIAPGLTGTLIGFDQSDAQIIRFLAGGPILSRLVAIVRASIIVTVQINLVFKERRRRSEAGWR